MTTPVGFGSVSSSSSCENDLKSGSEFSENRKRFRQLSSIRRTLEQLATEKEAAEYTAQVVRKDQQAAELVTSFLTTRTLAHGM